jgi:hypothetical protein
MILIPYFWNTTNPNWTKFGLFLCNNGTEAWTINETDTDNEITKTLLENGFPVTTLKHDGHRVYANIDYTRMKMENFYLWDEIDPKTTSDPKDVWRIFNIPIALWCCPVFKDQYWKTSSLDPDLTTGVLAILATITPVSITPASIV